MFTSNNNNNNNNKTAMTTAMDIAQTHPTESDNENDNGNGNANANANANANGNENSTEHEHEECAICKIDMSENANKSTTVCGHSFHFTCLARSMLTSPNCPICRTNLTTTGVDSPTVDGDGETDGENDGDDEGEQEEGEEEEEGEIRIHLARGNGNGTRRRVPHEVIVTEIHESVASDSPLFGNEVDLRREILEGIMHSICRQGDLAEARSLLEENPHLQHSKGKTGDLLTHEAVLSDNEALLSYLLVERSFDANLPNDVHAYPLHYAVLAGSLRMVTILVNHRAFVDCVDSYKKTPLMVACEEEDHEIAEFLLDRGASTMTQDAGGNKPIHFAVKSRAQACLRRIISAEANVNAVNHMDETPLFVACRSGYHGVSRTLLRAGADADKTNKFGTSPLDEAMANGSSSLVDLLRTYV